jgi:hypothetical protein
VEVGGTATGTDIMFALAFELAFEVKEEDVGESLNMGAPEFELETCARPVVDVWDNRS